VTAAQAKAGYTHSGTSHAPSDAVSLATVKADSDIADAISNSHSAVTVSAPISLSGQALSLVNDVAGTITEIDTGALADSDTVIPTSKAVTTAIAGVSGGDVTAASNLTDNCLVRGDGGVKGIQTTGVVVDDSGRMVNTSQPVFIAYLDSDITNATGDGTAANITGTWGEIFDVGSCFSNGVFTAPVTGKYLISGVVYFYNITVGVHDNFGAGLVTSNRTYRLVSSNWASAVAAFAIPFAVICDMDANDTAYLQCWAYSGTKVVGIFSEYLGEIKTGMSGALLC
jgi:hypothetical protein